MHRAGCYYHVYNRGCNREQIFANDGNYRFLLRRIHDLLEIYPVTFIAYSLMPNHYHFLLRPEQDNVMSPFIQRLFNSYSQAFNRQQGRSGTLFEGRVKSILVDRDEYLTHLCRYIHLNPVQAGLAMDPRAWVYSNYLEWIGARSGTLVDRAFIQQYFRTSDDYKRFVLGEMPGPPESLIKRYYLDY